MSWLGRRILSIHGQKEWVSWIVTGLPIPIAALKFALPILFEKELESVLSSWFWLVFASTIGITIGYWLNWATSAVGREWARRKASYVRFVVHKGLNGQPVHLLGNPSEEDRIERSSVRPLYGD